MSKKLRSPEKKKEKAPSEGLLGKKRDKPESDSSSSSEEEDNVPKKSIFGDKAEVGFKPGLFGDLSKKSDKPVSLFSKPEGEGGLFSKGSSLFGGSLFSKGGDNKEGGTTSLFGNSDNKEGGSLFGKTGGSLFSNNSGLFGNLGGDKKEEEGGDEEGDDQIGKSNSPNPYNPEEKKEEDKDKDIKKIFVKKVDNFYLYNKKENKYVSKGEGFISIETTDKGKNKFAFVMFRNNFGNLLCEGILNEKFNKFDSYEKKFKHISHFYFLTRTQDEKEKEEEKKVKYESGNAKIPFIKQEDCKTFGEKYKEAIEFLKGK